MTTKAALLRDVSRLLKKYKLADLSDAVSSLKARSKPRSRQSTRTRTTSKRAKKANATKSGQPPKTGPLRRAKSSTSTATRSPARNQTKHAKRIPSGKASLGSTETKRKNSPPQKKRKGTHHVTAASVAGVSRSVVRGHKSSVEDRREDYAKWFRIISGEEIKSGDFAADSTSEEKSKEWKDAIRHHRIRELLLSGPFKFSSTSANATKVITFLPDGAIGVGRSDLVARWRISEDKLELLDVTGTVRCRFVFSSDGRFRIQMLDPIAPSTGTTQLVRVAAKG